MLDKSSRSNSQLGNVRTSKYQEFGPKLSFKTKLFYSFGHVYNDLCASIWFSYTLLYFKLSFDDTTAGLLLFLGQLADAISTPLIGYFSDKNFQGSVFGRYGRRKIWHLIGSVFVTASFPFIFNSCVLCSQTHPGEKFLYYSAFIALFQFGWAAVQVSHVSLITDLSNISSERVELNSYRQAATVASSICVYTITLLLLGVEDSTITQSDSVVFMKVVHLITLIGIIFSVLFHIFVKEPSLVLAFELTHMTSDAVVEIEPRSKSRSRSNSSNFSANVRRFNLLLDGEEKTENGGILSQNLDSEIGMVEIKFDEAKEAKAERKNTEERGINRNNRIWSDWFSSFGFWKICLIYMMSRLYVNVTQVYTPLYLQETLRLAKRNIAIVPFITYFAGFLVSMIGKARRINSQTIMSFGCMFALISCIWIYLSNLTISIYEVFGVAAVFGIGGTLMLIGSLSLTADLINNNKISGAFVFGMMSFFDKLINGGVIALVQHLKPVNPLSQLETPMLNSTLSTLPPDVTPEPTEFYLTVLVFVSGAAVVVTFVSLFLIMKKETKVLWRWLKC